MKTTAKRMTGLQPVLAQRREGQVANLSSVINRRTPYALAIAGCLLFIASCRSSEQAEEQEIQWEEQKMFEDLLSEEADLQAKYESARDDLWKELPNMPLKKMVAMADSIQIVRFDGEHMRRGERLKLQSPLSEGPKSAAPDSDIVENFVSPEKLKAGDTFVVFRGRLKIEGGNYSLNSWRNVGYGYVSFILSDSPIEDPNIFSAPKTIVEDVKAEIKRQAKEQ